MDEHSAEQLAQIRADLLALRTQLVALVADETGATDTVELDQAAQGRLSRIDAIQQQKMAQAQRRRAQLRLERVESVLEAYDDPEVDFGCCRTCTDPIAYARLKAQPDALFCVECAQAREGR